MMRARTANLAVIVAALALLECGCERSTQKGTAQKDRSPSATATQQAEAQPKNAGSSPKMFPFEILQVSGSSDEAPAGKPPHKANRLAKESSPYLLLHAHNPVDWYAWGPEAFEAAKRDNKPIFLSVGYSSCYWCHVMERLVFSNDEIAKLMNDNFINVKVDREERPDIDEVYMTSLQVYLALSQGGGSGGWPLSMFLTPDGNPIAGGSYFPPQDVGKQFGFPKVAGLVIDAWKKQRADVEANAKTLADVVRREMRGGLDLERAELNRETVQAIVKSIAQTYDPEYGGIDFSLDQPNAPKFPATPRLALLLDEVREHKDQQAAKVLFHTLEAMAAGGIRDHLAGGFHRYSTDRQWLVPHFEKMLYDNAQLLDVYVECYRLTNKSIYRDVADEIVTWLLTEMLDANGGFYSAIDAETNAIEGQYYVWSPAEVDRVLGPDAPLFRRTYGLNDPAPFEQGHVLFSSVSIDTLAADERIPPRELSLKLASLRRKLLSARRERQKPLVDDKILAGWNGLAIRALANAGLVFSRRDCIEASERAAMFVLTSMRDKEGRLLRSYRSEVSKQPAFLDDYAYLIEGLLALHWTTRDPKWLNAARHLSDMQHKLFWDENGKGYFFTADDHDKLFVRFKDGFDGPTPSANSVSVRNLVRLASLSGEEKYRQQAHEVLEAFSGPLKKTPRGFANMALALSEYVDQRDFRPLTDRLKKPTPPQPQLLDKHEKPEQPKTEPSKPAPREPNRLPLDPSETKSALPGNTLKTPDPSASNSPIADRTKADRVSAKAYLSTSKLKPGTTSSLAVVLTIEDDWHINANPPSEKFLTPTTINVKSSAGATVERWSYPAGEAFKADGIEQPVKVYGGEAIIIGKLAVPSDIEGDLESLELTVRYQACNSKQCEPPRTIKFAAKLPVAAADEEVEAINGAIFDRK